MEYWKNAINLYSTFDNNQKEIFINILKQTIVDTISGVFGILDGSSTLLGGNYEFKDTQEIYNSNNKKLDEYTKESIKKLIEQIPYLLSL